MRHLDEGELHAYLDAADKAADVAQHLTECAECRARLEDVSRVRDRAAGILAAAAPQVSAPPFERVLVARAGRSVAAAKRSWSRQLAAAAVVALVVGVGWYATWRVSGTHGPEIAIAGSERAAGEPQAAGAVSPAGVAESARAFSTLAAPGESSVVA
ncbi:MAG TPA: hypothetical protein VNL18_04085, partial [Gemmatimonadales bacterium]|nr:hypothetical protein [Gemmatimonadales bacterium]